MLDFSQPNVVELQKFEKSEFNIDSILATAERLKYVSAVKQLLSRELENPGADLVKFVAPHVYDGRVNAQVRELVSGAIKGAFKELIRDNVRAQLSSALDRAAEPELTPLVDSEGKDVETTQEELEGYMALKAIVRDVIAPSRVTLRDARSYCAILVDNNNRKPLARLHFDRPQKFLSVFDGDKEERISISGIDDLFSHAERIRSTAQKYSK